jgi:general secretion pathway protein J
MRSRSNPPLEGGFTLVELLVSLTLLGMLSLVLLGGLHFGRSVWQASETKTAAVDRIRAFQVALAAELQRAYPEIDESNATEGTKVKFDGEKDRVTFLTPSPDNSGLLVRTTVRPESFGDRGFLVEQRHLELVRAGRESVVDAHLPAITSVRLSYFGSVKDNEAPDWHESWSNLGKLPDLLRVRVTFADRRFGWPDLVVKPRVEADVTCTFDPLARACSGR